MISRTLKWSAKLEISSDTKTQRLQGDKINLPQSALKALLAAAPVVNVENKISRPFARPHTRPFDPFNPYSYSAEVQARSALSNQQQELPHPLTFRLVNQENGRAVYAGIREFSAEEGEVDLSAFLLQSLGFQNGKDSEKTTRSNSPSSDAPMQDSDAPPRFVTVHVKEIPRGTYVRLRPLEAGYDAADWKSLLERHLRDNFTTLTNGEILTVPVGRHENYKFLVDKFEPEGPAICIVDTDLEVDIEALNEEQARETLQRRLDKAKKAAGTVNGSSAGGAMSINQEEHGQIVPGEYVDYELKGWDRSINLQVNLEAGDDQDLFILASPFSARQRSRPRLDEHVFADLGARPVKRMRLSHTNVEMEAAESLYISVHAVQLESGSESPSEPIPYSLSISAGTEQDEDILPEDSVEPGSDEVRCKNCQQIIPKRTLPLHEAFCYRNNVSCSQCKAVFLKNSDTWKTHWHCPHDEDFGSGTLSKAKHDLVFHPEAPLQCLACDFVAFNLPILAQHRTTTCPSKEILCQFCHLIVPQQGPDDPPFTDAEVLLMGLTPHELVDGARTTECHLCSKIVRLRDMKTHLLFHDRERISKSKPALCINGICGRTLKPGKDLSVQQEHLGLCADCFGPLYHTAHDPEGKALRRRVERRLLQQLTGGCGRSSCHNVDWCRTGRKNSTGEDRIVMVKDALPIVKPVLEQLAGGKCSLLRFCVDEAAQTRRVMGEMMASEGVYELEWCIKALEEAASNAGQAAEWLKDRAPRIGEVVH